MSELEFKSTKTCPFLDRLCIGEDCPSFEWDNHGTKRRGKGVVLVQRVSRWKNVKAPHQLIFGYNWYHTPRCMTLGKTHHGYSYGSIVGEVAKTSTTFRPPRWEYEKFWDVDWEEVSELPDSSQFIEKGEDEEN